MRDSSADGSRVGPPTLPTRISSQSSTTRWTKHFDRLDIVVNVAGYALMGPFSETTPDDWDAIMHRNLGWVMHSISLALPRIRRRGQGGSIINFTTIEAHRGPAGFAAYAGAKAGLTNFSRTLGGRAGPGAHPGKLRGS